MDTLVDFLVPVANYEWRGFFPPADVSHRRFPLDAAAGRREQLVDTRPLGFIVHDVFPAHPQGAVARAAFDH